VAVLLLAYRGIQSRDALVGGLAALVRLLEETAFTALEAKTKASEQRASDEGTATQGLRVKLEGMEADRDKCKAEMEKLTAELEKVAAEKDAAVAHQKELQDALDAANKQLKKEAIVIASKDEFIKTLIQTPAAA